MKNKHLIKALEFAKSRGATVTRQHVDGGMTMVRISDSEGKMSAGRVYKTGSANPQARYIIETVKRFKLFERGHIIRDDDDGVYFHSEDYKVLYRWHAGSKQWRVWISSCDHGADYIAWCLGCDKPYKAKVDVEKLTSGLYYA